MSTIRKGDVIIVDLTISSGYEQNGVRPAIAISSGELPGVMIIVPPRAGIKRALHKKLTQEQRAVVEAIPEAEIGAVAEKLGLGLDNLKAIKRSQRNARW